MQRIKDIIIVVLFVALMWVWRANADDLPNPDTGPASTESYTINAIYERLDEGTPGSQSAFTDPSGAPGTSTMKTLNDVMDKAPVLDTNGASQAEVVSGKTFWGLTSGEWGLQTGSMVNQGSKSYTPNASEQTIMAGYYDGTGKVEGDSDLAAGNIKKDVEIFGVTGTFEGGRTCSGTLNGTRWCDNGDGTVTDMTTGLIWLQKADWGGLYQLYQDTLQAENAYDRASLLKDGAADANLSDNSVEGDWRLPTLSELKGLANGDEAIRSNNMRAFTGVQTDFYWSGTSLSSDVEGAWYVDLSNGFADPDYKDDLYYVWPVRGGE